MKIITVIGARPQFIKAAAVSRRLRLSAEEVLVHTGQHYDKNLSKIFFDELDLPQPNYNLAVGSNSHGKQTAHMLSGVEDILLQEVPDLVLVYGDTNSTLAGALAAVKLHIRIAHVEAGLRSYNRRMPEEINRILTDHISDLLFCPSDVAVHNLLSEGLTNGVMNVGDVMADSLYYAAEKANSTSDILQKLNLEPGGYFLATIHRAENTDRPKRLANILLAFSKVPLPVVFAMHPRTKTAISHHSLDHILESKNIITIDPLSYLDIVCLEKSATMILTDSGGIQKEAYWLGVPCLTIRDQTEWVETVQLGWNSLVKPDPDAIVAAIRNFQKPAIRPNLYGDGNAGQKIVHHIINMQ